MWYSFLIAICICLALLAYFAISRKLKTPTVTTEVLITRYNKRLEKLSKFLLKNKIEFPIENFKSEIEKADISFDKIQQNVENIAKIELNNGLIEDVFVASNKKEAQDKLTQMQKIEKIYEFAGELEYEKDAKLVFEILGFNKTKLDFELQRYFGSQYFYKIDEKMIFIYNSLALLIDPKNVFDSKILKYEQKIEQISKKIKEKAPIYRIIYKIGSSENEVELSVPQEEVKVVLDRIRKK